jgi:hypothetical protein
LVDQCGVTRNRARAFDAHNNYCEAAVVSHIGFVGVVLTSISVIITIIARTYITALPTHISLHYITIYESFGVTT